VQTLRESHYVHNHLLTGKRGEQEAEKYLKRVGYAIIDKNFRSKIGEIDIIAKDDDMLVFIEVKTRTSTFWGSPAEAIKRKKLHSIIRTSQYYLLTHHNLPQNIRIDAIEILVVNSETRINHIKNITL